MTLMLTDPISDYLTRVRNAITAQHAEVEIPSSRLKREMSRILSEQGYIDGFAVEPTPVGDVIKIQLKYTKGRRPVVTGLRRISRPGQAESEDAEEERRRDEARQRAEAEQAALEQLKEENPEAYAKPERSEEGEEGEEGEAPAEGGEAAPAEEESSE